VTRLLSDKSDPIGLKDIPLLLVGFPAMVIIGTFFWIYSIYHDVRERISIRLHGDRSKE
jgi:hypothetical protein